MPKQCSMLSCLIILWIILFINGPIYSQQIDHKGSEFIFTYLTNTLNSTDACEVYLQADIATDVTVEYPVNSPTFSTTVSLVPGDVTIVSIPTDASNLWNSGIPPLNNAVRAYSPAGTEFSCVLANLKMGSSDATLALPVDALGTDYIVIAWKTVEWFNIDAARSQFIVTALEDNTILTITPSRSMAGTVSDSTGPEYPAGVPFNFTLNRGESFFGQDRVQSTAEGITGTIIESDKPVAVSSGNRCTEVGETLGNQGCSHLFEMLIPTTYWENVVHTSFGYSATNSWLRIFSANDNTEIRRYPGAPQYLGAYDRGEFADNLAIYNGLANAFVGTAPIQLVQFTPQSSSSNFEMAGTMHAALPVSQFNNRNTFRTISDGRFARHDITIIAEGRDVGLLTLDGVPVAESQFVIIPETPPEVPKEACYYFAVIEVAEGVHQTASPRGHWVRVTGQDGSTDGYSYSTGAWFNRPPATDVYDPQATYLIDSPTAFFHATDSASEDINENLMLDPGEDLNGDGVLNIESGIMSVSLGLQTNLRLNISNFKGGKESLDFTVSLIDSCIAGNGNIRVRDCSRKFIDIPVQIDAVLCPSNPPMCDIHPPGPITVNVGQTVNFTVSAWDLNLDEQLTLEVSSLPAGATMNPALPYTGPASGFSSEFNWIPDSGQGGTYPLTYTVTDENNNTATATIVIFVNGPPTCSFFPDPGPITVSEGDSIGFIVFGGDPISSDQIILDVAGLPAGATLNPPLPQTGDGEDGVGSRFSWIPAIGQAGSYMVMFSITDNHGMSSNCSMDITVNSLSGNTPPVAVSQDVIAQVEDNCEAMVTPEQVDNGSHDPDNDPVTLSLDPPGPYPVGMTTVILTVTDDKGASDTSSAEVTITGGTGTISGKVVTNSGIAGVPVKLLKDANPTMIVGEQITDTNGNYSFADVQVGIYQVMIVEPLGYKVYQNFIPSDLTCGASLTVDFQLTEIILVNKARSKGYWKHQFDVYVKGKGNAQEPEADLENYLSEIVNRYNTHYDFFLPATDGYDDFEDWQAILSVKGKAGMKAKATSQLAALVLNMMSLKVGQYETVTSDGRSAGDVLSFVSNLLVDPDSSNDELAKDLAEQVNLQRTIGAGMVPAGGILFKGGNNLPSIDLSFGIPTEYALFQNYPNPFNPSTTIRFNIAGGSGQGDYVTLRIYDLTGRTVRNLFDGSLSPGSYRLEWDGANNDGHQVAGGIYLYRIRAGDFTQTRKLILVK